MDSKSRTLARRAGRHGKTLYPSAEPDLSRLKPVAMVAAVLAVVPAASPVVWPAASSAAVLAVLLSDRQSP